MKVNIGNNNKINKNVIGSNNSIKTEKKENIFVTILITTLTGIVIAGIVYYLGWN